MSLEDERASKVVNLLSFNSILNTDACLILGGETTVTFEKASKEGRNQKLALAAALALTEHEAITIGTLATDGTDGPTDSARAIVDATTARRAKRQGFSPLTHLLTHNAYPLLDAIGDLLRSGPTNTNVNDLLFIVVEEMRDRVKALCSHSSVSCTHRPKL